MDIGQFFQLVYGYCCETMYKSSKLWMLSEESKKFDKNSDPNQSKPNQSNQNFFKSPWAPWSYF